MFLPVQRVSLQGEVRTVRAFSFDKGKMKLFFNARKFSKTSEITIMAIEVELHGP